MVEYMHHFVVDYFPIIAHLQVFYSLPNEQGIPLKFPGNLMGRSMKNNKDVVALI